MNYREHPLLFPVLTAASGSAITVDHANAYTIGDVVGGQLKCFFGTDHGGRIIGAYVTDKGVQSAGYIIHVYGSVASTIADDAAFAPTDADAALEIGTVSVSAGDYATARGSAYSKAYMVPPDCDITIPATVDGAVWVYLETLAAVDYVAATDLVIDFLILVN